jgi:flagellar hook-length control protein FliK
MGIESFFTIQSGLTQPGTTSNGATSSSVSASQNFLDLILGKLNAINEKKDISPSVTLNKPLQAPLENSAENTSQIKAILLQYGLTPATDNAGFGQALITPVPTPTEKQDASLLGLLQISTGEDAAMIANQINQLRAKIQNMIKNGDPAMITSNLTPEQLNAVLNSETGDLAETLKGIDDIVIALLGPSQQKSAIDPEELNKDPAIANLLSVLTPFQAQKTSKNGLSVLPASDNTSAFTPEETLASRLNALVTGDAEGFSLELDNFQNTTKPLQTTPKAGDLNVLTSGQNTTNKASLPAGLSFLQGLNFMPANGLYFSSGDPTGLPNDLGLAALSAQPLNGGLATSLITHSSAATLAHPATQMLAVNIQKAAGGGQDRTISLALDPPELGRVEVRLSFSKNKTMKAHVITEKPETYMMLQRDAETLQRALSESGLESDGGLSFELAEQGFDFHQNNERGGGHDNGGTGTSEQQNNTEELIHTTMTWHIDPHSGHVRYDILV